MGAFPVVRGKGDMGVIDESIKRLKKGRNLVIFPEGTRSKDGKVGKGKTGVALIAAKANVDVVPVGIIFEGELKFRKRVVVKFGKPINAETLKIAESPTPAELKNLKLTIMSEITKLVEG
jgi:1-acyl-sn-glycerol-3-phosphate acyltransferase